ncbi:MAG: RNA-directed DNA polymerase [Deferribacteres bacterium]|nr:RNA-directed DNA polymerase [candidate division KSB1 bacterium]MCB9500943.1 RNA-directed DNA polymerase [Deferribacteres bacterium]
MPELFSTICDFNTLLAAWERVRANGGCRGSDGISIASFSFDYETKLRDLSNSISSGAYHPFPLLRFPIPKNNRPGERFLSVPTVRDRLAQTAVFLATRDIFEAEFENLSHAYRPGRGVRTAVYDIKEWRDKGYRFAVDADISAYFDNVPHDLLLQKLDALFPQQPQILRLFKKWIRAEIYDGTKIWRLEKGIPQGSVVSPLLANLFLDELDETLMGFKLKLVRYADDFLILAKSQEKAEEAIELTDMLLDDMHLELNPLKTKIVSFDHGFKFLGAIFLQDGVYLSFPEKKKKKNERPNLPAKLDLRRYLEYKNSS